MLRVGQMVVCIDVFKPRTLNEARLHFPEKGRVYTIREIHAPTAFAATRGPYLTLEEIVNPQFPYHGLVIEPRFNAVGFRPVKETSIDVFTSILNKEPADA